MGDGTKIEWADATWNPIVGCSRVSPGCDNCYAIGVAHRGMSEHHKGLTVRTENGTDWNGEIHRAPDSVFHKPLHWKRPRRIFVNSLSDLFHPEVSDLLIAKIVAVMSLAPQHTFQILTKRPQRMQTLLSDPTFWKQVSDEKYTEGGARALQDRHLLLIHPLSNVWWGTSIESNRYAFRADHLRNTPAAVRWISAEPLLGPLDELDLTDIDWVVAGGESGPGARPMHPDWVRDLRDSALATACSQCGGEGVIGVERPHSGGDIAEVPVQCSCRGEQPGTAFFLKQWGDWAPADGIHDDDVYFGEFHTGDGEWIEACRCEEGDQQMIRVGKKRAGRELDGRTWDEYPMEDA